MSELTRLYRYRELLSTRTAVSPETLMARLEVSKATLKRDVAKLRDQLNVPILFDRDRNGYVLEPAPGQEELPGLWFSPEETHALVTLQHFLSELEPSLLGPRLKPLQEKLMKLMAQGGLETREITSRIRVLHAGKRALPPPLFAAVAGATLSRRPVRVLHLNRQTGQALPRVISPQRIVHYRENWYVDAWCHLRSDLRSFAVDALRSAEVLADAAQELPAQQLDDVLGASYGIFGGKPKSWATLRFSPTRARWVQHEQWHPRQESKTYEDGTYELTVPYSDERELLGDILRFGKDVQVVSPARLRSQVQKALLEAAMAYTDP